MFVLMGLIFTIALRRPAWLFGMGRPVAPTRWAKYAPVLSAFTQQHPLAPIPMPALLLTI